MKRGATENAKILDLGDWLADRLNLPTGLAKTLAVGLLEKLWQHTARQTPAGDIGKMSDRRIADAVDWPHDPTELVRTLVSLRLLDEDEGCRLIVHDWHAHSDNYADRFLADSGLRYACGRPPRNKPRKGSAGVSGHSPEARKAPHAGDSHPHAGDSQKTVFPYSYSDSDSDPESDPDPETRTHSSASAGADAAPGGADRATDGDGLSASDAEGVADGTATESEPAKDTRKTNKRQHEYTEAFEAVWVAYGRRGTKGSSARAFKTAVKALKGRDGPEAEAPEQWLVNRAKLYASIRPEARFRPHLERWLRDSGFDFDEDAERAAARSSGDGKPDWRAARREREYGDRSTPRFNIEVVRHNSEGAKGE